MAGDPTGLSTLGTGAGIGDAIARLLAQRLAAARFAEERTQNQSENAYRNRALDLTEKTRTDALAEQTRQHDLASRASTISARSLLPPGADISEGDQTGYAKAGVGGLSTPNQTLGSTSIAGLSPLQGAPDNAVSLKTLQSPQRRAGYTAQPTFDQTLKLSDLSRKNADSTSAATLREAQAALAEAKAAQGPKEPTPHFTPVPLYDDKGMPTGAASFNTLSGAMSPITTPGGAQVRPAPGASQAATHAQAKKDALGSLDQLDQAIESARNFIGPGAGRVTSINKMIGSQDPSVQALGTKMLLTKMQVDHAAAGTVRAGASPTILARWDNILSDNVTPEGLKAAVQAMREVLGGGSVTAGKPKFEIVSVK